MKKKLRKNSKSKFGEVTKIEKQKRGKKYNLYLNEVFAFSIYEETLVKFSIGLGKKLSEQEIKKICEFDEKSKAQSYAFSLLSLRPRSLNEVRERLLKKFSPKVTETVLSALEEKSLISDEEFCRFWAELACRKLKSKRQISFELYQKKVDKDKIEKVLRTLGQKDEVKKAKSVAERFRKRYRELPETEQKLKLKQILARRGFDWEVINLALN